MRYITPLIIFWLGYALPAQAHDCFAPVPPRINVTIHERESTFDTSLSKQDLAKHHEQKSRPSPDLPAPSALHGLTGDSIKLRQQTAFRRWGNKKEDWGCIQLDRIDVQLSMMPTIMIAKEYADHPCQFGETFWHEARHIEVDRGLIKKYAQQMKAALVMVYATPRDQSSGLVPYHDLVSKQKEMETALSETLAVMFKKMTEERARQQQEFDQLADHMNCVENPPEQVENLPGQ